MITPVLEYTINLACSDCKAWMPACENAV